MKKNRPTISLIGPRIALRYPVGLWKQWRERAILPKLKYQLAVCAIFREEAPFLDEWLAFHVGIGVSHFYLYNNFSTDDYLAVLKPWQAAGYVTLTDWPIIRGQVPAYHDCLRRFKNDARWIAFMDVDEFLFAPHSQDILPVLAAYAHLPGLEVWHIYFGANGHVKRPASPVIEAYTRCGQPSKTTVKTIANPRMIYKIAVHQSKYWKDVGRDTAGQIPSTNVQPVFEPLRINHYWSRSFEDMKIKFSRGDASLTTKPDYDWHLEREREMDHHDDFAIQPIARAIRHPLTGKNGA